ncbi:MAG: HEAT repeat domain-containing protein, partial [Mesorhizobium sp.]
MSTFEPFEEFGDIDEAVERLNDTDSRVRQLAVIDLGATGRPEVLPHL